MSLVVNATGGFARLGSRIPVVFVSGAEPGRRPTDRIAEDVKTVRGGLMTGLPDRRRRPPIVARIVYPLSSLPPALLPLWRAVHARLASGQVVSRVRPGPLTVAQREALADLLGLAHLPAARPSVSMGDLDAALLEAVGATAREVVTQLLGPPGNRVQERQRAQAERVELWDWLGAHPVVRAQPALDDWVAAVRRGGLIGGSVEGTRRRLADVLRVLERLPASGEPLPVFADAVLGDTHALDDNTRAGALVLRALAAIYQVPAPVDAQQRRALWDRAGIADDELSSTVLCAGLWVEGQGVVSEVLKACAGSGVAAVVTLQQLRSCPAAPSRAPARVWVVENPSLTAMALRRFGRRCPPLVCTAGWPSSAGILLLQRLRVAGTVLLYHGDFDGEGLRIAANVVARTGAVPWRMTSTDYLEAVLDGPPVGQVTEVPWDPELAGHLTAAATTVPEERVAAALLDELACHVRSH